MALKKEVRELLQHGHEQSLADLVAADRRALRPLLGRLWDPDDTIRRRAASAVGIAAAAHPELGVEVIRRLLWALNDESATNGVFGIPALAEIGRRAPEMLAPYVPALVSMAWDGGLRLDLLRALHIVAAAQPDLVRPHLAELARHVDHTQAAEHDACSDLTEILNEDSTNGA
jgi:hypothetical protein